MHEDGSMLTAAKLGAGQESYYLSKVASGVEDYYSGHGESSGQWLGVGARSLGLACEVDSDDLRAVLAGESPGGGEPLVGRRGGRRAPGWDLTFSAPKSVSVLYALGGADMASEVTDAHQVAVSEALSYLERYATVSRRRGEGGIEQVAGEGLVVAAFQHRTSRAGDPQLHTHALVANVVRHSGGRWGAVHSPVMYRHLRTAGFVYQAVLRGELTERLGVSWEGVHNGYSEITDVEQGLRELFSKRRAEIEEALDERGEDSARAAQVAAHQTRKAKEYGVDEDDLYERWESEAERAGFGRTLELHGERPRPFAPVDVEGIVGVQVGASGLTAMNSTFEWRDLVRDWCERVPVGTKVDLESLEELAGRTLSDDQVLDIAEPTSWTTKDMVEVEQALIGRAVDSKGAGRGSVDALVAERFLAGRDELGDEQAAMVTALATSGDGVQMVVGRAGTGKTYALAAAAQLWRSQGLVPVGVALAARAAAELETGAGIRSGTVAQFLTDEDTAPGLTDRHVVVVDEAGMVDTRRLSRLVTHAERAGAKVVLVGDHHQLPSVEAGGAFAGLVASVGAVELAENRRQRELWERDTLARLRTGSRDDVASVVHTYGTHGRVHVGETPNEVRAEMVQHWYEAIQTGASAAMVALRRGDVAELNCRARALLVADGTVAAGGLEVNGASFSVGDRIVCLRNNRRLGVHNSMFATVIRTNVEDGELVVAKEADGEFVNIPSSYIADGHVDHGYATTIHKSQGATYDRLFFLGDERLYRQAGYTALSRGRDRNDLYLVEFDDRELDDTLDIHAPTNATPDDPHDRIVRSLSRDGAKRLAIDHQSAGSVAPAVGTIG